MVRIASEMLMRHAVTTHLVWILCLTFVASLSGCTSAILTDPGHSGVSTEVTDGAAVADGAGEARPDAARPEDVALLDTRLEPGVDVTVDVTVDTISADTIAADTIAGDTEPDLSWWTYEAGIRVLSPSGYIEFIPGNSAVIVTAPHGGYLEPAHIPDRTGVTVRDARTQELTREFTSAFHQATGKYPHVVINLLARVKLDANREIVEAAEGNPTAEEAWHEFHRFIDEAKTYVASRHGRGLYLDVHGHAHAIQRVELGYMISAANLRLDDEPLSVETYAQMSSVRTVWMDNIDRLTFAQLLRGPMSFGTLLEAHGFPSVPSMAQPAPLEGWAYFSGGYNTDRHGSRQGGPISGIQLEVNRSVRVDDASRRRFARALVEATLDYLANHYGIDHRGL
jgi:hypothetical protein